MSIDWSQFVALISSAQRFVLTSHLRPDADALGSELGMARVLESLGKEVRIVNAHAAPPHLEFLDPENRLLVLGRDVAEDQAAETDLLLVLDTGAWAQLGDMAQVVRRTAARKVVLDHHVSGDDLGAEVFKDPTAEATGRLVVDAAEALGVPLTAPMAAPLFAAVATDTGWFRFASTSANTYQCAARLIAAGAQPAELYAQLYEQNSFSRLMLMGRVLAHARGEVGGKLLYAWAEADDFAATGALRSDTEDIVNELLRVAGAQVALLFVEQPDGRIKVSFRSRSSVDVSQVAEQFGGGGHRAASGASLDGPLSHALPRVLDGVRAALR